MTFGKWVRKCRRDADLTQTELGDLLDGATQGYISAVENDSEREITRSTAQKFAKALGRPAAEALAAAGYAIPDEGVVHVLDEDEAEVVKYLRGIPPELRPNAVSAVKNLKTAADIMRERQEADTIGKRADRHENPSIRQKEDGDDALRSDQ